MGTDVHGVVQYRRKDEKWWTDFAFEDGRNYTVFAVLANVRNGSGFAGVPTHTPIVPISDPRGLPDDFRLTKHGNHKASWGDGKRWMGDHSWSWVTLEEATSYDWDQQVTRCGVITREQYKSWDHQTSPSDYSGGIYGKDIVTVDETNMNRDDWTHIRVWWDESLSKRCGIYIKWLDYIKAKYSHWDEARLVFGFDS